MIHQRQVLSTPLVGGGVDDTERGIRFGIVGVTVRPDQDGVAVPAGRKVLRTIDIESLLLVSVDRIGGVARQGPHHLVGRNLERARGGRDWRWAMLRRPRNHSPIHRRPRGAGPAAAPDVPRPRHPPGRRPPAGLTTGRASRRSAGSRAAASRAARSAASGRPAVGLRSTRRSDCRSSRRSDCRSSRRSDCRSSRRSDCRSSRRSDCRSSRRSDCRRLRPSGFRSFRRSNCRSSRPRCRYRQRQRNRCPQNRTQQSRGRDRFRQSIVVFVSCSSSLPVFPQMVISCHENSVTGPRPRR